MTQHCRLTAAMTWQACRVRHPRRTWVLTIRCHPGQWCWPHPDTDFPSPQTSRVPFISHDPHCDPGNWGRQAWHVHRLRGRTRTITDVSEEAYLRDDVPCGSAACTAGCRPILPHVSRRALRCVYAPSACKCVSVLLLRRSHRELHVAATSLVNHLALL